MKKNTLNIFAIVVAVFTIISCSKDDKPFQETNSVIVNATISEKPTLEAGVIEDNPDFKTTGEKFFWHNNDEIQIYCGSVITINDFDTNQGYGGDTVASYRFKAVVANGQKPKSCSFTNVEGMPLYPNKKIYHAFYPANDWHGTTCGRTREDGWECGFEGKGRITASIPDVIEQTDLTSKSAGRYMYMFARVEEYDATNANGDPLNLNFIQLTSLFRIHIRVPAIFFEDPKWDLHQLQINIEDAGYNW